MSAARLTRPPLATSMRCAAAHGASPSRCGGRGLRDLPVLPLCCCGGLLLPCKACISLFQSRTGIAHCLTSSRLARLLVNREPAPRPRSSNPAQTDVRQASGLASSEALCLEPNKAWGSAGARSAR